MLLPWLAEAAPCIVSVARRPTDQKHLSHMPGHVRHLLDKAQRFMLKFYLRICDHLIQFRFEKLDCIRSDDILSNPIYRCGSFLVVLVAVSSIRWYSTNNRALSIKNRESGIDESLAVGSYNTDFYFLWFTIVKIKIKNCNKLYNCPEVMV